MEAAYETRTFHILIHAARVIQYDLYHAGQIAFLKKA